MPFPNPFLTEQPDSPRITEDDAYKRVERRYKVYGRLTEENLRLGRYLPDDGYIDPETDAKYVSWGYDAEVGYPMVVLYFEKRLEPDARYDLHEYTFERPIEQHPSFVMKWLYELYASDTTTAIPAWGATATDKSDTVDSTVWRWSKAGAPSGFKNLRQKATKPGVSSYLINTARITKRKVYTEEADAIRWSEQCGLLLNPLITYGFDPDQDKWLLRDHRIVEDRNAWAVTLEFLHNPLGWDTDIYTQSSVVDEG